MCLKLTPGSPAGVDVVIDRGTSRCRRALCCVVVDERMAGNVVMYKIHAYCNLRYAVFPRLQPPTSRSRFDSNFNLDLVLNALILLLILLCLTLRTINQRSRHSFTRFPTNTVYFLQTDQQQILTLRLLPQCVVSFSVQLCSVYHCCRCQRHAKKES